MKLTVRYFASIRESLGAGEAVEIADGATVGAVREALIARGGAHAQALARGRALRCALNQMLCDEAAVVTGGAEIAFFPPVTGG
ncbi:MAG: MoaD/ThiS family protein [Burkholderiaceae bacterium]